MAASLPYTVRPLDPWIGPRTQARRKSPFGVATWISTLDIIAHELRQIGASRWVLQIDVEERWINRDGSLHARAVPFSPAVRVSFECRYGPLMYATDRFDRWQINVRAIALSLEALRRVDRYGVAGRGEQYRGWTAVSSRPHEMTREQAAEFIAHWAAGEMTGLTGAALLANPAMLTSAYRAAARATHPDRTGDPDTFARINVARDLLVKEGSNHR